MQEEQRQDIAAAKAGMDPKTARKYARLRRLPSELKKQRNWRTRPDPFAEVWQQIQELVEDNPGLEAKTIFEYFQRKEPGRFCEGQLRTLQRRLKRWRAMEGPASEVYFAQQHWPGRLSQSDFTHLTQLGVTIQGQPFPHLIYHFVLTYSNWEAGMVCFSESFESLSEGLQNALWELGAVPEQHRTDRLSAAVNNLSDEREFTRAYEGLLRHYGLKGQKIQAGQAHENGDIEQRHHRFQRALDQALMLRGSRDFAGPEEYREFLRELFRQLNAGRQQRLREELVRLRPLPDGRLDSVKRLRVKVSPGSLIAVAGNSYSVHSRLIGEWVEARLQAGAVEVWYGGQMMEQMPRLRGQGKHRIDYRHVIDWLVRKPGAFENYRYQAELFPTSRFRMAWDELRRQRPQRAAREYLEILSLAAGEGETRVDEALRALLEEEAALGAGAVRAKLRADEAIRPATEVAVEEVSLASFDELLQAAEAIQ